MNNFLSPDELQEIGLKSLGSDVLISRKASIYGASNISVGDHVRIDDFCILSGNITIGNYVHVAAFCCLFGGKSGIVINDFTGISSRSAVYADSDDYLGAALTNPTVPDEYRHVTGGTVIFEKHVLVGSGCTVLPDVTLGEGASVGCMSLVNKSLEPWGVYAGIPCRRFRDRGRNPLELETRLLEEVPKK